MVESRGMKGIMFGGASREMCLSNHLDNRMVDHIDSWQSACRKVQKEIDVFN